MKTQLFNILLLVLLVFPIHLFAQHPSPADRDITGLWKGTLYNDTTAKYLPYEIAINEEKGKLDGYSYILFDINGKKEWGVKRIKIKIKDDQVIIEDVELISNDYSEPPPRKVRLLSVTNLLEKDSALQLTGRWSTNQTREYKPLTGSLFLQKAIDYRLLVLFEKLVELKLEKDLSFVKAEKKAQSDLAIKEKPITETIPKEVAPTQTGDVDKPREIVAIPPAKKTGDVIVVNGPLKKGSKPSLQLVDKSLAIIEIKQPEPPLAAEMLTRVPAPVFEKKTGDVIAINGPLKKGTKPSLQSIEKSLAIIEIKQPDPPSAAEMLIRIPSPVFEKKTGDVFAVNASLKKGNKPTVQSIVKALAADKFKELIKPPIIIAPVTEKKKEVLVADNYSKKENNQPPVARSATIAAPLASKKTEPLTVAKEPVKKEILPPAENVKKPARDEKPAIISAPAVINKTAPVIGVKEPAKTESNPPKTVVTSPDLKKELPVVVAAPIVSGAAANVSERKMSSEQSVYFDSDSLLLTLYDNGEVDGDTVSVLMNGKIIFAKQGLTTNANSKTIYVEKGMDDSLSLVMYAENLGSIAPNTGLLIIRDGEKRYEVRFSADLKTNAAILLRRRIK